MDWGSKMPPWDLAELEQNTASKFIGGSGRLDCSVDLKLGGLGEFGGAEKWKEESRVSSMVSSSPRSSKRARVPGNGGQNVSCSVDGCKADLGKCREYHRRHKVCEAHSKTPIVVVGGQEQRFCQQCSRFHMLMEFDEAKRSCRKRLDGHNRRRRKPQRETINTGSFFSNHQGTTFSSYPQIIPSPRPQPSWAGIVKAEEDTLYTHHPPVHFINRQQHLPSSFRSYREGKQFPFLQDGDAALGSRMTITPLESSSNRMFPDGLTQVLGSDCALSLLSSPTQSLGIDLSQMAPSDRIPMGQPLMPSLQYGGLGRYSHSQDSSNVSRTGFSCSEVEDDRIGIFHVANGEGSSDGPTQGISFSWQ